MLDDLRDGDALAAGEIKLPVERPDTALEHDVSPPDAPQSVFGKASSLEPRANIDLATVLLTWELAVFIVATPDHRRSAFAAVPGRHLAGFLDALERGDLDAPIGNYLRSRHPSTRLLNHGQTTQPGLFR